MPDYDPTNRGSLFKPFRDTEMKLQGRLNIDGNEVPVLMVKQKTSRDGPDRLVLYAKIGILFDNDKKGNDKAPDYTGPLEWPGPPRKLAGWKGFTEKARHFLQLRVNEKQSDAAEPRADSRRAIETGRNDSYIDDEIPF